MKIAVIDLGTNTFHLLLASVSNDQFTVLHREKVAVKIGEKGINEGKIIPEAEVRALAALRRFKDTIEAEKISNVFATATSAIRNAGNGKALIERILKETGISVRIISGEQEAEYIYYGVARALDLGEEKSLIMDIGGGSIEFIIANKRQIFWLHSFEIGGQRMMDQFQKHDPILAEEKSQIEAFLDEKLQLLFQKVGEHKPQVLIGSSGTFDTLSDIQRIDMGIERELADTELPLSIEGFHKSYHSFVNMDRATRMTIPGMIELRVEMIVVASILVNHILAKTGISQLRVSSYALKEGVLLNTIHKLRSEVKKP